jgi:hypothetical protein
MVQNLNFETSYPTHLIAKFLPGVNTSLNTEQSPRKTYKEHVRGMAEMKYRNKILFGKHKYMELLLIHKRKDLRNTSCHFTNWTEMVQNRIQKNDYFCNGQPSGQGMKLIT